MEELKEKELQDYIDIFKRNKNKMLLIGLTAFFLTLIVAIKWPATFKSTAIILIEQQEIPQDLVRSTVTSYADQRIQVISQRVMSSLNLKQVIEKYGLYKEDKKNQPITVILENMRENIHLEMMSADVVDPRSGRPTQATIAFTLWFEHGNAKKAQQVTNELVNLYLNENLKRRSEIASEATGFLRVEADKLSNLMSKLEEGLAQFKERNEGSLPELQQLNMSMMDRTEQQILETNRQLASAGDRIVYLNAELSQIEPNMTAFSATGQRIYGSSDRLKVLQAEFVGLKSKYVANHPDVVKMRKQIEALEDEVGGVDKLEIRKQIKGKKAVLATLKNRYSSGHPDVKKMQQQLQNLQKELASTSLVSKVIDARPDNPAYVQLLAQLNVAKAERSAMMDVKRKQQLKLEKLETGLLKAPQVERKYLELTREYDNTLLKYREVKAKQMEADMSQAMEKDRKAEKFSLIEPPQMPEEPFKPNRMAIIFLGFLISIALSVTFALIKEGMNPAIYGTRGLVAVTGANPLIVIPYIDSDDEVKSAIKAKKRLIYSFIAALFIIPVMIHFLVMPLDVLWFLVFRKLGMN